MNTCRLELRSHKADVDLDYRVFLLKSIDAQYSFFTCMLLQLEIH